MADAAKDWQRFLSIANDLESLEEKLKKESYIDPEDNPLKLLQRLRVLSEKIPIQQKAYSDLLHEEQEIAEKIRDAALRNVRMLESLERADPEAPTEVDAAQIETAYRTWEEEHIKETENSHASKAALAEIKENENKLRMRPAKGTLLPADLTANRTFL